jgi:hypothetical protein
MNFLSIKKLDSKKCCFIHKPFWRTIIPMDFCREIQGGLKGKKGGDIVELVGPWPKEPKF